MRKYCIVLLTICCILLTTACNDKHIVNSDTESSSFTSSNAKSDYTQILESNENSPTQATESNESTHVQTAESKSTHQHSYIGKVIKQATCTSTGTKEYRRSCGESYTETISRTDHSYSSATCTSAKKCTVCGATSGEPLGHNFSNGYCTRCNTADPTPKKTLKIPSVPLSTKHFIGEVFISSIKITDVKYEFHDEMEQLIIYLSGEKTSDYNGNSASSVIGAKLKLYDSDGYVVYSNILSVPNLKVGDKFRNEQVKFKVPKGCTSFSLEIVDN